MYRIRSPGYGWHNVNDGDNYRTYLVQILVESPRGLVLQRVWEENNSSSYKDGGYCEFLSHSSMTTRDTNTQEILVGYLSPTSKQ